MRKLVLLNSFTLDLAIERWCDWNEQKKNQQWNLWFNFIS